MDRLVDIVAGGPLNLQELLESAIGATITFLCYSLAFLFIIATLNMCSILAILFFSAWYMMWYKNRHKITELGDEKVWMPAWQNLARVFRYIGGIWHGYQVIGMEKVSWNENTGALFVFYHGPFAIDMGYLTAEVVLRKERMPRILGHRMNLKWPAIRTGVEALGMFDGQFAECVRLLKEGQLVFVAPGGTYEIVFSDNNYDVMWNNRTGFAKVALEAKVPIIPVFCANIQEGYFCLRAPRVLTTYLYEKYRMVMGCFLASLPVKLRIYIGDPIPYNDNITHGELAKKVKGAVEELIRRHQRIPGSMISALMERFRPADDVKSTR